MKNNNSIQALWVGIGSFSSFTVTLISAAILSRVLNKTEYGTYKQILYVYNTLLVLFTAGLPRVFSYFLPRYALAQGKEIVIKISKFLFFTGLIFSVFLFISSGFIAMILNNPELARGLKYFSPVPMLLLPTLGIEEIFSTYKRTVYIAIYNTLTRVLILIFVVAPVILISRNYITAIFGWVTASVIIAVIAYFFKGIPFHGITKEKSELKLEEILQYSLPLVSATIAGSVYMAANQFYISRFFGPEIFAEFSNGFIQIPFVNMITFAASTILMPLFSKTIYEKSDISKIADLWRSALQKTAVLVYPMVIYCMFFSKEIITFIYSEVYSNSSIYFSTALFINFFNIIVFSPLLLSMGESKLYARIHYGLAFSAWLTEYIAVLIFKTPLSVAISFVIIDISGIIVSLAYSAKLIGVNFLILFPIGRLVKIALHSFVTLFSVHVIIKLSLPHLGNLLFFIITSILYLGLLITTSKWFKINYWEILIPIFKRQ